MLLGDWYYLTKIWYQKFMYTGTLQSKDCLYLKLSNNENNKQQKLWDIAKALLKGKFIVLMNILGKKILE